MKRRDYLKATGVAGMGALAGCANLGGGGVSGVFVEQGTTIQEEQRGLELQVNDIFSERSAFVDTPITDGGVRLEHPPFERFVYVDLDFFEGQPERYNLVFVVDDTLVEPIGFSEDFSSFEPIDYEAQGEVLVYRVPEPLVEDADTIGFSWRRLGEQAAIWEVEKTAITEYAQVSNGSFSLNNENGSFAYPHQLSGGMRQPLNNENGSNFTSTLEGQLDVDGQGKVRILVLNTEYNLTRTLTYPVNSDQNSIEVSLNVDYVENSTILVDWGSDYQNIQM